MTLYEFLKETNVDVRDIDDKAGNYLDSGLRNIDYDKNIDDFSDKELLEIARNLILPNSPGQTFFSTELVERIKNKIVEVKARTYK